MRRPPTTTGASCSSYRAAGRAPSGFAAIPAAAIDPPHRAASPAVPALIGSGSPSRCFLHVRDFLKLAEQIGVMLCKVTDNARVTE